MNQPQQTTPLTVGGKLADPSLWHQPGQEVKLGCTRCPELPQCGGLAIAAPAFNCMDLCCDNPKACRRYVCPKQRRYSKLVNEAGGFDLRPYKGRVAPMLTIPDYVPCVLDIGDLAGPLPLPVVAVSLYALIDSKTGLPRYHSRQELLARFRVDPEARIVITATGKDRDVERFWHVFRAKKTAESLRRLRPALIATPNFSMHADTVRHDNLVSMSRIASCFEEFAAAGLPTAVHVNGRAPHDFRRWLEYLNASPAIYSVSYEMGTMGRSAPRRAWHAQQLVMLARSVQRPLTLLLRGGFQHIPELSGAFARVIALDTSANMKAKMRQSARRVSGRLSWTPNPTPIGQPIDELLIHNIRVCGRSVRRTLRLPLAGQATGHSSVGVSAAFLN
ncbi:hypothetical protein RAS1_08500 [Phycisphaerae bacterium RAS1]|nr:hypothetical protein RAS1_08500 [Phycisphaerae bacterium RAS1]